MKLLSNESGKRRKLGKKVILKAYILSCSSFAPIVCILYLFLYMIVRYFEGAKGTLKCIVNQDVKPMGFHQSIKTNHINDVIHLFPHPTVIFQSYLQCFDVSDISSNTNIFNLPAICKHFYIFMLAEAFWTLVRMLIFRAGLGFWAIWDWVINHDLLEWICSQCNKYFVFSPVLHWIKVAFVRCCHISATVK